jgi:tetratricopeptide (TPR) repeat protein
MNEIKPEILSIPSPAAMALSHEPSDAALEFRHTLKIKAPVHMRRWIWLTMMLAASGLISYWSYHIWRDQTLRAFAVQCEQFSKQSQWDQLTKISKQWSDLQPDRAEPWLYRAEAAEAVQDWQTIADCLARLPRNDRRIVPALARKAGIEFENLNLPWDGLKTLDELIRIDSRVLLAHKQSIFLHAMTLQRAEMVRRIRAAIRVHRESPESYVYLAGASWFYGSSLYKHNTHWLQSNQSDETFQVARAMQIYMSEAKTNLEEAARYEHIPTAEELLLQFPHNLELLAYFLNLSMENGDLSRVEELLAAVPPELADDDARVWRARAWLADSSGDLLLAAESLRRAFAIDPYWYKVHYQLHDVLRRLEDIEQSNRFLQIYEVSLPLAKMIMEMNQSSEAFDNIAFRELLLKLADLVGDDEVATALRNRMPQQS